MNWSPDEQRVINDARDYESLLQHPAYAKLLNIIGQHAAEALATFESIPYADKNIRLAHMDSYTRWNKILYTLQSEIRECITQRDILVSQVLASKGYTRQQIDDILKNHLYQGKFDATNTPASTAPYDPAAAIPQQQSDGYSGPDFNSFDASQL